MDQINSLKEIDATARYELASRLQGMPRHTKLCHGDFNPSNVIVAPDGKLWVIDWAHAAPVSYTHLDVYKRQEYSSLSIVMA